MADSKSLDLTALDIPQSLILCFLQLMETGKCPSMSDSYRENPNIKGTITFALEIIVPIRNEQGDVTKKGSISILKNSEISYPDPTLTKDMLKYTKKVYMNHDVYLHPEHEKNITDIKSNKYDSNKVRALVFVVRGKGCITFTV